MDTQNFGDPSINLRRIAVIWLVLSVIADLAIIFLLGPHMPPGSASAKADEQRKTNIVLAVVLSPIVIFVWTYFALALGSFRQRGEFRDGDPIQGDSRLQGYWIVGTLLIVALWSRLFPDLARADQLESKS